MVDRQDIDALLIGSLYGELSSAEEARLSAHLESHPADRTALANLTRAREIVHESRILQVQLEPPQSVSALLMQEAARRAPKSREEAGWFQRFMRSFLAHPAMAAAVMLVLVIGVAGTVYMKRGDHFAKATQDQAAPALPAPPAETPVGGIATGSAPADDYKVNLDDGVDGKSDRAGAAAAPEATTTAATSDVREGGQAASKGGAANELAFNADGQRGGERLAKEADADRAENRPATAAEAKVAKNAPKPAAKTPPRLEVTTPSPAPKDFAAAPARDEATVATRRGDDSGGGKSRSAAQDSTTIAGGSPGSVAPTAPPPPPPPPPAETVADTKQEKASPEIAWAKERHGKAIAAVKAGKCELAAGYVIEIANRVPGYYQSTVADDRALKSCAAYITAQRERDAERTQRAKATQRRAADEPPAPAPASTK